MEKNLLQQHAIIQNFGFTSRGVYMHKKKTDCTCIKKAQIFSLVFCDFLDPWYYDCGCLGTLKTACIGQHFDSLKKE